MGKYIVLGTAGIMILVLPTLILALNIEFLINVPDRIFYPNETIPINISLTNKEVSAIVRDANLTVNISKRTYTYELGDIEASDSIVKDIVLPEFPPGDYVIHGVLKYIGFFDEEATLETFNSFHVRFPEIERFPRNIVIKGFEITSDITEGETYTATVEVSNEGEVTGNLIIKLEGLGASASKTATLSPGQTEMVNVDIKFYNPGISVIEARVYAMIDGKEYLLSFDTKDVFVKASKKANIEFDSIELVDEPDNEINEDDEVKIKINLKNMGNTMASGVRATLVSSIQGIEITASEADYKLILADGMPVGIVFGMTTHDAETGNVNLDMDIEYTDLSGTYSVSLQIPLEIKEGSDSCSSDNECKEEEACVNSRCTIVPCECGEVVNHVCQKYSCCSDLDCEEGYECSIETYSCQPLKVIKRDVLIISSGNLVKNDEFYSSLKEYRETINAEDLSSFYIEVDSQKVQDLFNVQPADPTDWTSVIKVTEKALSKLEADYLLILGGIDVVAMPEIQNDCFKAYGFGTVPTDEVYADMDYDRLPDIAVGRMATGRDRNSVNVIINALNTATNAHKSGGLRSSYRYLIGDGCLGVRGGDTPYVAGELDTKTHWSPPYCSSPTYSCNYREDMFNALKLYDIIYFATHGSGKSFASQDQKCGLFVNTLSANEIPQMDNTPLIMSFACFGGAIDYDAYHGDMYGDESTTVSFLYKGVANFLANTRYGLAFKKSATVNMNFYKKLKEGKTSGEALKETKREMLPWRFSECGRATVYEVQIYGDPTLKLAGA